MKSKYRVGYTLTLHGFHTVTANSPDDAEEVVSDITSYEELAENAEHVDLMIDSCELAKEGKKD